MEVILLISSHCDSCKKAVLQLESIKNELSQLVIRIIDIHSFADKRIFITPAWIVNGELYSYGEINEDKLLAKLK